MLPRTPSETPQSCTSGSNHQRCTPTSHGVPQTDLPGAPSTLGMPSDVVSSQECETPPNVATCLTTSLLSEDSEDEIFFGPVTHRERRLVGVERDFHRRRTILLSSPSNNFQSEDENTLLETDDDERSYTASPNAGSTVGSPSPWGSIGATGSPVFQVLLPALVRGYLARQRWRRTQKATAAIQRWWRMLRARRAFLKWRAGLILLRQRWLTYRATVVLQRWWRSSKLARNHLSIPMVTNPVVSQPQALDKTPQESLIEPASHVAPIGTANTVLGSSIDGLEVQYTACSGQTRLDPNASDVLSSTIVSGSYKQRDKSPPNLVDGPTTTDKVESLDHLVDSAESNSTGATYHSPETNDNAPEEITAQPASPPLNRRTSSRLSTRVTDAPNSSTASSEPPTTRSTGTTLRRGRLARKAPPRRKLAELSAVEVQRVTTRNTQFNEKYNQCPLELVVIHRDIPRPVSPTLDPIVEAEASEDDNSNGEKEHDPVSANSELLEMPTLSLEEPSTALLDRSLDNVSLDDTDGDSTGGSSRRIRWDPKLVTLETTHPTGHMEPSLPVTSQFKPCLKCSTSAPIRLFPESPPPPLTAEERWGINLTNGSSTPPTDSTVDESDSLPTSSGRSNLASRIGRPGQDPQASSLSPPSTVIQRLLYVDDDLDDPELQEQLVYRNRVYRRALRATRDLVATGESPMDVDPEALEDITRDLLGKGKAKSTKRRKKSR